jgi:hypothetical protein
MLCTNVNTKFPILALMYSNSITIIAIRLSIVWGPTAAPAEVQNENYYLIRNNTVCISATLDGYDAWYLERCVTNIQCTFHYQNSRLVQLRTSGRDI